MATHLEWKRLDPRSLILTLACLRNGDEDRFSGCLYLLDDLLSYSRVQGLQVWRDETGVYLSCRCNRKGSVKQKKER